MSITLKRPFVIFILLVVIALVFRWPSLFIPYLDIDEILWGLAANAMVDGGTLYVTVMGEKPPLLYGFYAILFFFFGKHNYLSVHIAGILWMAATGLVIHGLVKKIADTKTALVAAGLYIIFGSATGFRMLATTGELLFNLPLVLSLVFFMKSLEEKNAWSLFVCGALVALAALFRQQAIIQGMVYVVFLILNRRARFVKDSITLITGGAFVGALCLAYLIFQGSLADFYFWNGSHNISYIQHGFLNKNVIQNFSLRTGYVLITTLPLWILAGLKAKAILKNRQAASSFERLILLYLIFSLIAVVPGGRFFPHYFLQAFPPLVVLAALALRNLSAAGTCWSVPHKLTLIFLVLILCKTPFTVQEMRLHDSDYGPLNKTIGQYIQKHTIPNAPIFVWGWCQGIYYYADRRPASRFISSDFLTGRSPSQNDETSLDTSAHITPGSWDMLFEDFAAHPPVYILDTSPGNHHGYGLYPLHRFERLAHYITRHYQLEKTIAGIDLYRLNRTP